MGETRRTGPGAPPIDDSEAVEYVRHLRLVNPRIGYLEVARRYFQRHPEKLDNRDPLKPPTKLESAARRVADKAKRADGRLPRRSDADALALIAFRLNLLTIELHALVDRLKAQLPTSENRPPPSTRKLLTAILSMEAILEEIKRRPTDE